MAETNTGKYLKEHFLKVKLIYIKIRGKDRLSMNFRYFVKIDLDFLFHAYAYFEFIFFLHYWSYLKSLLIFLFDKNYLLFHTENL